MATSTTLPFQATSQNRYLDDLKFDWLYMLLCFWTIGGASVDVWAHANGYTDDSFFTKWHALLYSGFMALTGFTLFNVWQNHQRGFAGWNTLPKGYKNAMLGIGLFLVGGLGDMVWHVVFGIETDIEALISPTHLLLIFGGALVVSGPVGSAWFRSGRKLTNPIPVLIGITLMLSTGTLLMLYTHPIATIMIGSPGFTGEAVGLAGVFMFTLLFMTIMLMVKKRWDLPFGSFTLILLINTAQGASISNEYKLIFMGIIAGLLIDGLNQLLQRNHTIGNMRLFAFLTPIIYFATYNAALYLLGVQFVWAIHMWAGAILVSGIVGLLVSYLVWQPEIPTFQD